MLSKITAVTIIALLLGFPGFAGADSKEIAYFELSLAGYQIDMTIDEATMVRPFHYFSNRPGKNNAETSATMGYVDNVFLNDIEFSILAVFQQERLKRIIGHFPGENFDTMKTLLFEALGPAEDRSKVTMGTDNSELRTIHFAWSYPEARVSLVAPARNVTHGTLVIQKINKPLLDQPQD